MPFCAISACANPTRNSVFDWAKHSEADASTRGNTSLRDFGIAKSVTRTLQSGSRWMQRSYRSRRCFHRRLFPRALVAQQPADERGVHSVSGPIGHDAPEYAMAKQREIADQVQNFVPHELIRITQRAILHPVTREHDRVLLACAADQSHVAHRFRFVQKTEGPCRGDVARVQVAREIDFERSLPDQRMGKIDGVRYAVAVVFHRIDPDELATFAHFQLFADSHIATLAALLLQSNALHHVDEGLRAAIEDGQLEVVELDDRIIYARANECGEKMFGGRDEHALLHQAGRVAHARNVSSSSFDFKIVEVNATEDDSRSRGRG